VVVIVIGQGQGSAGRIGLGVRELHFCQRNVAVVYCSGLGWRRFGTIKTLKKAEGTDNRFSALSLISDFCGSMVREVPVT
jgi:hypothetical protein